MFPLNMRESLATAYRQEIKRLKEGRFTPEELQNLCHNLPSADECAFKQGCEEYQKKLFGKGSIAETEKKCQLQLQRLWAVIETLPQSVIDEIIDKLSQSDIQDSAKVSPAVEPSSQVKS